MRIGLFVAVFGAMFGCCSSTVAVAQTLSADGREFVKVDARVIALEHVRVIDGTGGEAGEDQTIILKSGKIQSVAGDAQAIVPKDAQVLDLRGYTVIPGLVGMH